MGSCSKMNGGMGCSTAKKGKKGSKGGAKKTTRRRRAHLKGGTSCTTGGSAYEGGKAHQNTGLDRKLTAQQASDDARIEAYWASRNFGKGGAHCGGHEGGKAHQKGGANCMTAGGSGHEDGAHKGGYGIYSGFGHGACRGESCFGGGGAHEGGKGIRLSTEPWDWISNSRYGGPKGGKKHAKRTIKRGKKSGKKGGSRRYRGGKSAAGASPATQGFQNLLQATDYIEKLDAQQKALQQQKISVAAQYAADQKALSKAVEQDVMKPGYELLNAMRQQAANTSEKTTAGFKADAFLRS